jgi:hypothetical protein
MPKANKGISCIDISNRRHCLRSSSARNQSSSGAPHGHTSPLRQPIGQLVDLVSLSCLLHFDVTATTALPGYLWDIAGLSQSSNRIAPMRASPDATKVSSPSFAPKYRAFGSAITSRGSL